MEDLVDYFEDPLEGASSWSSSKVFPASSYHFGDEFTDTVASLPSISGPPCSTATLSEVTPSIPDLAGQALSPSTLNFVDQSLYPSLGLSFDDLPSSVGSRMPSDPQSVPAAPAPGPFAPDSARPLLITSLRSPPFPRLSPLFPLWVTRLLRKTLLIIPR